MGTSGILELEILFPNNQLLNFQEFWKPIELMQSHLKLSWREYLYYRYQ